MIVPASKDDVHDLEPVHEWEGEPSVGRWASRLVRFLRVMAVLSIVKGLYHWARVLGIGVGNNLFEYHSIAWQSATVFFAVIDLVAAVGLWLAASWGAVIWLISVASMLTISLFFPQVFGARLVTSVMEGVFLVIYLLLALKAAQEQPR